MYPVDACDYELWLFLFSLFSFFFFFFSPSILYIALSHFCIVAAFPMCANLGEAFMDIFYFYIHIFFFSNSPWYPHSSKVVYLSHIYLPTFIYLHMWFVAVNSLLLFLFLRTRQANNRCAVPFFLTSFHAKLALGITFCCTCAVSFSVMVVSALQHYFCHFFFFWEVFFFF